MPGESCRTGLTRPRPPTRYVRRSFVLPLSTPYDRRHGVCVARMRAVNRAFSLERVQAARQTRRARDEAEHLRRAGVGGLRKRLGNASEVGRSEMSLPDNDDTKHNVVRLGTETLFAIAEQLRRMYDADLRTKPSEELERLMRRIERGQDVPVATPPRQPQTPLRIFLHLTARPP